jgi:hypothetical protein
LSVSKRINATIPKFRFTTHPVSWAQYHLGLNRCGGTVRKGGLGIELGMTGLGMTGHGR